MGKKIVAFGEILWDVLPNGKVLGGTPANLAFHCNAFGEEGHLLTRIGDDENGNEILVRLKELGLSDENVQIDSEFPTGTVHITFNTSNEPRYNVPVDVAFDHIEFSAEALKLARNADCLFFGLLPQRFGLSKNTIRELIKESNDSLKFFDLKLFQHFFDKKVVENLLNCADIVRIKEREISFLSEKLGINSSNTEKFGQKLATKYKVSLVLITRGNSGVLACKKDQEVIADSGYLIKMKDNIGSGMAFSAAFLHYYLNGKSVEEAVKFGNGAGALNATFRGATSYFNKKDVLQFMQETDKSRQA